MERERKVGNIIKKEHIQRNIDHQIPLVIQDIQVPQDIQVIQDIQVPQDIQVILDIQVHQDIQVILDIQVLQNIQGILEIQVLQSNQVILDTQDIINIQVLQNTQAILDNRNILDILSILDIQVRQDTTNILNIQVHREIIGEIKAQGRNIQGVILKDLIALQEEDLSQKGIRKNHIALQDLIQIVITAIRLKNQVDQTERI